DAAPKATVAKRGTGSGTTALSAESLVMVSMRERFLILSGPGLFQGMPFGDWVRLLADNAFDVELPYGLRAGFVTFWSLLVSVARWLENARCARALEKVEVQQPLFVLGHWRSGTTHLHNLLALDERFAFPNFFQVFHPHTFLGCERLV